MNALYSPLNLALLCAALAALALHSARRWLLISALVGLVLGLGLTTPLGANLLVRAIESPQPTAASEMLTACPGAGAVVFLSGGLRRPPHGPQDFGALTAETLDRIVALQASNPPRQLPLIVSGGGPFRIPEAEIIAALLMQMNPGSPQPIMEKVSTTTRTSALEVAHLLRHKSRRIILATSALHLPRARWAFEQEGFEVCPWALNSRYVPVTSPAGLWPQSTSLDKSERALYELFGGIYYRLIARAGRASGE